MNSSDALQTEEFETCLKVLRTLSANPDWCASPGPAARVREQAAHLLSVSRKFRKTEARGRDRELLDAAEIRHPVLPPTMETAALPVLHEPRRCYICKQQYRQVHAFYDSLCPTCGDFNYAKRSQSADLTGKVALITGGRIKIGYHTALKLLRAGAEVVITTRFPRDAARRYAQEADFSVWSQRLQIHALDLRFLPGVESFATALATELPRLDIVINNAAQTVRRPPAFYRHLLEGEADDAPLPTAARLLLSRTVTSAAPPLLAHVPILSEDDLRAFPPQRYDEAGQQVDLRDCNSWALELGDVAPAELLEVHAVNCLAPFMLLRRLEPLLFEASGQGKYVVNVSAMEGQFNGAFKSGRHPHTNMAKAGLNMITRTCAACYAMRHVFMNSVDTGWITNEAPHPRRVRMADEGFREPLDVIDGAARVLDPVFVGLQTGQNEFGKFWKDYRSIAW